MFRSQTFFFYKTCFFWWNILFGETSFGKLCLGKLPFANLIWQNFIWCGLAVPILSWRCHVLYWLRQINTQTLNKLFSLPNFVKLFFLFGENLFWRNFIWRTLFGKTLFGEVHFVKLYFAWFGCANILSGTFFFCETFNLAKLIWRTSFGETSFGELHLAKLHLANFIWCGLAAPILSLAVELSIPGFVRLF